MTAVRIEEHYRSLIGAKIDELSKDIDGVMWDAYLTEGTDVDEDGMASIENQMAFILSMPGHEPSTRLVHQWNTPVTWMFGNEKTLLQLVEESWNRVVFTIQTQAMEGLGADVDDDIEQVTTDNDS